MADADAEVAAAVDASFRAEWGRIVATLIGVTGDWDLAEECAQDAFARALQTWTRDGVPDRPGAWLTTTARNRAVDVLRRRANEAVKLEQAARLDPDGLDDSGVGTGGSDDDPSGIPDDRLRLIFTCCHPALPLEARVALTLRTLAGLTTAEIARALLVAEPTMAQRTRPRQAQDPQRRDPVPGAARPPAPRAHRGRARRAVPAVQRGIQRDLRVRTWSARTCARRRIRLARLLARLMPGEPEASGLLALMLLQDSRRGCPRR